MTLNRAQLERLLPHRPPILMLDRVVDIVPGTSGKGMKHFSEGNPCFAGHFPGMPILPGALTIEALAQTAAVVFLAQHTDDLSSRFIALLGKVNEMTFLKRIVPGDEVEFAIEVHRKIGSFAFVHGEARVDGKICAAGKLTLKIEE